MRVHQHQCAAGVRPRRTDYAAMIRLRASGSSSSKLPSVASRPAPLDALNSIPPPARVALDDTTLSGANLALLTRCNFDFIKIDRQLVAELAADKPQAPWLNGLRALLQTTSVQIIAEGVETAFQAETLRAAGVQLAQGHYFSQPLSARDFKRFCGTPPDRVPGAS